MSSLNQDQVNCKTSRLENTLLLAGLIVASVGTQIAMLGGLRAGIGVFIVGTLIFVGGCCQHCHRWGRSWACGLWSLVAIFFVRVQAAHGRSTDLAERAGEEMGRTLASLALGYGVAWLMTRRARKAQHE